MINLPLMDGHRIAFYGTAGDVAGVRPATFRNIAGRMRLASEPIGAADATLLNVVVGSIWRIEDATTGATIATGTASASTVITSVSVFSGGGDTLKLKVRKATSAPYYQPFDTQLIVFAGVPQSVFVNQVRDDQ
jgi:hypothetical protein